MMKTIQIGLFVLGTLGFLGGCAKKTPADKLAQDREKVEKATPAFNPTYFKSEERQHLSVFFEITDGKLQLTTRSAEIRPGKLPYRSSSTGTVLIIYRDSSGKEVGRYAIDDPILARSCDLDERTVPDQRPISRGAVEVLLPADSTIVDVEIGLVSGQATRFNVSKQIRKRRRPEQ